MILLMQHPIRLWVRTGACWLLWSLSALPLFAAVPDWSVTPSAYSNSMVMVGAVNFDRVESLDAQDMVAAFINGECRGVSRLSYQQDVDRFLAYLMVYGNETEASITFRLYDASDDKVYEVPKTKPFVVNGLTGELEKPYVWSSVLLNEDAELTRISIPEQVSATPGNRRFSIFMKLDTDRSALVPSFGVSEGATVWVDGQQQQSGQTAHDFSQPVTYVVRSEDEQTFAEYVVEVKLTESRMGATLQAVNAITPNGDGVNDQWVIRNLDAFEGYELLIYNSAGNLLYQAKGYQNNWDGTYKGRPLPEGAYYYLFRKGNTQYRGVITILQ